MKTISQPGQPSALRPVRRPAAARSARRLDAAHAGHADVEKDQVGVQLLGQLHRFDAVLRLADDLELGPDLAEAGPQLVATAMSRSKSSTLRALSTPTAPRAFIARR